MIFGPYELYSWFSVFHLEGIRTLNPNWIGFDDPLQLKVEYKLFAVLELDK